MQSIATPHPTTTMHLPSVLKGHKDKDEEPKEVQKETSGDAGQSQQPEQQCVPICGSKN